MRKRYKKRTGIGVISIVVLILFGIISYRRIGLADERENAAIKLEQLDSRIEEQTERKKDIEELKEYTKTKEYKEEIARNKLGLVYEDEIIFEPEE
jgi:cell division protein DivIC